VLHCIFTSIVTIETSNRTIYSNGCIQPPVFIMINITASSSPIGSEIFSLLALLVISLGVLLLLRHYLPLRTTPAYLLVPIFFALGLPASIILLVPIDLASSARNQDAGSRGIWLPDRVLLVSWRISYWLTFALTWYINCSEDADVLTNSCTGSFFLFSQNMQMLDTGNQRAA
jgi:hypothetical protein